MFRLLLLLVLLSWVVPLYAATDLVSQGIAEYKDESFEEAAASLEKAHSQQPDNYEAIFYLGMSYMQMLEFEKARTYLEKASAMQPEDAKLGVYLGEAFYNLHDYKSAENALTTAIASGGASARAHYFLGMTRYAMGNYPLAVESFDHAMQMDEAMKVKALYLMAMAHRNMGDQEASAREFKQVKQLAPDSFEASQSDAMLRQSLAALSNFHINVSLSEQYDSNVVLAPASSGSGVTVTRSRDYVSTAALNAVYNRRLDNDLGFSATYGFSQSLHRQITFYDVQAHHLEFTPYLNLGADQAFLRLSGDAVGVDYRRYMGGFGLMPGYVHDFGDNQKGTALLAYQRKVFFPFAKDGDALSLAAAENRDANNYLIGYTYTWNAPQKGMPLKHALQTEGSSLTASYMFDVEKAGGSNWSYFGHHGTLAFAYPVWERVMLTAVADQYRQIYRHINTSYNKRRSDVLTTLSPSLEWKPEIVGGSLKLNYSFMRSTSNIAVYDYRRSVVTASFERAF